MYDEYVPYFDVRIREIPADFLLDKDRLVLCSGSSRLWVIEDYATESRKTCGLIFGIVGSSSLPGISWATRDVISDLKIIISVI